MQDDTREPETTTPISTNDKSSSTNQNLASKKVINKKALSFIILPSGIWIAILLIIQYRDKRSPYGASDELGMINIFVTPLLLTLIVYGLVLLFINPRKKSVKTTTQNTIPGPPSYKDSIILFLCGLSALAGAYLFVLAMRFDLGYSGSEGELGAVPFILGGIGCIFASLIMSISTLVRRIIFDQKNTKDQHKDT